jgi:DNA polymerase I-like protein with 3'-5' exonuclease and polymerase domains
LCLYVPGKKAAYVPLHHVSYVTGIEVEDQISDEDARAAMQRVKHSKIKVIMFNAKFDIRVINNQLGVELVAAWDGYLAARLLNENEGDGNNGLKALHKKYCMNGQGDAFSFDSLFKGIPFTHIPIKTGYLYAARDAEVTYELYMYQLPFLTPGSEKCISHELEGPAFVLHNIELPLIQVVARMEDTGITFDFNWAATLSERYHKELEEKEKRFYEVCAMYSDEIEQYKRKNPNHKLSEPVSISSPTQLSILFYDILQVGVIDKKNPRGTGEDIMLKIDNELGKAVLAYREVSKLLSTYVDKMPNAVNEKTGRIHCSFNQIGADTGRFSSSDPNMQNIPSHNKDIRKMFRASKGCVLLSSDYSAQEPRLTAHMSKDEKMIAAYKEGKDLYVEIASIAFDLPYDECIEFRADGTKNPEGKERRNTAKAIVLGVCYGKGVPAIAEDLKITVKKAQQIYDKIMKEFPGLKKFMDDSEELARTKGYVTTVWGRKRRLPNMQLPLYEFSYSGGVAKDFDPMFDEEDEFSLSTEVDEATVQKYTRMLTNVRNWKEKEKIKERAETDGILIKDNGGYIAEAKRQCVNSRIQGSAADQTKLAMILIDKDEQLKELGFKLLLPVHDELIGECPRENAKAVSKRFAELMVYAAKDLSIPSKCDVEITEAWYGDSIEVEED